MQVLARHITKTKYALRFGLLLVLLVALLSVLFFGIHEARAAALGAILAWLSYAVFAWFGLRYGGATQAVNIYKSMWQAHMYRWVITILGFVLILVVYKPKAPHFALVGYVVLSLGYMGISLIVNQLSDTHTG